ncbi:hypothetical protein LCGC14_2327790 [marine sediment metagenome]|uniref:Uncharacterized protein n=1 Tax=marine sediment metagenome TaxID=412755 RepID=A0A0F9D3A9_9ZZZZ
MIALIIALVILGAMLIALWRFKFKARFLPIVSIGIIVAGIGALSQPWILLLYRYGLAVLITGVSSYILTSHFE